MTTLSAPNPFSTDLPPAQTPSLLDDQCVDMKFITEFTIVSDKWIYKKIKDGEFPPPIKLGRKSVWLKSEVEQWMMQRIRESRGGIKA
ncbi:MULTISPECIES: helix-turn-helix transcriptional regulator [Paenalcaligenes]|uniref:helix-turn-helix transcriptional regulator n=1 Tax=Paenalcaligenes TaxID=1100891 RepID=UPI0022B95F72|nr:AlpA family phage regulatory protein [Paenalcaligenes faecalis]